MDKDFARVHEDCFGQGLEIAEVRSRSEIVLGLGRMRKFMKGLAQIAAPLNMLMRKDVNWQWTPDCKAAFEQLKDALTSHPAATRRRGEEILREDG